MPRPKAEIALRRLVTRLAALHAEDIAAVLADLDDEERQTVNGLLREHTALFADIRAVPREKRANEIDLTGLSPWLAQRVDGREFALAEGTRKALAEACTNVSLRKHLGRPRLVTERDVR